MKRRVPKRRVEVQPKMGMRISEPEDPTQLQHRYIRRIGWSGSSFSLRDEIRSIMPMGKKRVESFRPLH